MAKCPCEGGSCTDPACDWPDVAGSVLMEQDWEIWSGPGLAVLVLVDDPDKKWLLRVMPVRKYAFTCDRDRAEEVFDRAVRRGFFWPQLAQKDEVVPPHKSGSLDKSEDQTTVK